MEREHASHPERARPRILALIPARGGSKGVPRKNVRLVCDKPLLAYSIEAARRTPPIQRIVVTTDDAEIATISRAYGAEVIQRPAEISGDTSSSEAALLHALAHLKGTESYQPDMLVFLQCTSPLTLPQDIEGTIRALLDEEADSAVAVTPFHYFVWRSDGQGGAQGINHDARIRLRRQDREPQYLETGAVYAMRTAGFLAARHRFFGKTAMYVMPAERCLEIDEPRDLVVAEALLRERQKSRRLEALPAPVDALVLDFDGVFTDNRVLVFGDGGEAVLCDRGDGWGLARLNELGLPILVLSTEANPVVQARCAKLGLECIQGCGTKLPALRAWLSERGLDDANVVYVGNDLNDLECLRAAGCGVVPADAHPQVRPAARIVLSQPGGHGAVREIADLVDQRLGG